MDYIIHYRNGFIKEEIILLFKNVMKTVMAIFKAVQEDGMNGLHKVPLCKNPGNNDLFCQQVLDFNLQRVTPFRQVVFFFVTVLF